MEELLINGKSYPIKFGYKALKEEAKLRGFKGTSALLNKIAKSFSEPEKISFDDEKFLGQLVLCGIKAAGAVKKDLPDIDDVLDAVLMNPQGMETFARAFYKNMPKQGNPEPS